MKSTLIKTVYSQSETTYTKETMMKLEVFDLSTPLEKEAFNTYFEIINPINPFYVFDLLQINTDGMRFPKYFVLFVDDNPKIIMPFFLRRIIINGNKTPYYDVSSPYGYSGPLFGNDLDASVFETFWKQVDAWYKNNNVISEFMRFSLNGNHQYYSGTIIKTLKNVKGMIRPADEQWCNFKKKVKSNYRKAMKSGLSCRIYHKNISAVVLQDFFNIYIETMKRRHANSNYYLTLDYFKSFVKNNADIVSLAIVYKDRTPLSAELILLFNDFMYSFLGGSISEYLNLRPNDFLKLEVINWGRDHEYKYYILGGGLKDYDSLYIYKKSFFSSDPDVSFYTGRKILNQQIYDELVHENSMTESINTTDASILTDYFPRYREVNNHWDHQK